MMITFSRFFLILLLLFFQAQHVLLACSCTGMPNPLEAEADADFVFVGEAVRVIHAGGHSSGPTYEFTVDEVLKGEDPRKLVTVRDSSGSCEIGLEIGVTYLIYGVESHGAYYISPCSRTRKAEGAEFEISILRRDPLAEIPIKLSAYHDDDSVNLSVSGGYGRRWILESSGDLEEWSLVDEFYGNFDSTLIFFLPPAPIGGRAFFRVREIAFDIPDGSGFVFVEDSVAANEE